MSVMPKPKTLPTQASVPLPTDGSAQEVVPAMMVDPLVAATWGAPVQKAPVGTSIKKLAQRYTMDALGALVEVIQDKQAPAASRVAAATQILDRGYGKPKQYVDVEGEVVNLSLADLLARRLAQGALGAQVEPEGQDEAIVGPDGEKVEVLPARAN